METQKGSRRFLSWALRLLGIGLFLVILSLSNVSDIMANIKNMDMGAVLAVLGFAFCGLCIRAYRWSMLVRHDGGRVRFRHVLRAHLIGIFLGMVTPGKIGEHAKGVYICKHYPGMLKNLFSTVVDRYIELTGFLAVSAVIVGQFVALRGGDKDLMGYYLTGAVVFFCALLVSWPLLRPALTVPIRIASRIGLHGISEKLEHIRSYIRELKPRLLVSCLALTFLYWTIFMVMYIVAARGLDIPLSPVQISLSAVLAVLAVILPISIGGLGTREAALIYVFNLFGQPSERAISLGIIIFSFNFLFAFTGFIVYMLEDPRLLRQEERSTGEAETTG